MGVRDFCSFVKNVSKIGHFSQRVILYKKWPKERLGGGYGITEGWGLEYLWGRGS